MQAEVVEAVVSKSKWSILREAISGTEQDFTEGSLKLGIALLAIPTMLEMAMESTFAIVDAFWVARLGSNAVAAIGLTEALVALLFTIGMGLSVAASATVARRIGEKDPEGAADAAVQSIGCGVLFSVAAGICAILFAPQLLGLMGATPEVIHVGSRYTRVLLGGNLSIILLFLINGVFRGSGDAVIAMRTLWLANLINLALDPCLIYGWAGFPRLGVTGAAVATTIGRSIGILYQLWMLWGGRARVTIARRHLRIDWQVLRRLAQLARTASFQYFVPIASWVGLARLNATFGSAATAGYTLALRIIMFGILPSWGISSAAATLVGQNLGARRPERSERAVWLAGSFNTAFLLLVGAVFFFGARPLVSLFTDQKDVAAVAVQCLRLVSLGYPFYAWGMVMEQAFNGAGDTVTPTWMNLGCYWALQLPLAWYLTHSTSLGSSGVYLSICTAEAVLAVISVVLFRRGKWKEVKV